LEDTNGLEGCEDYGFLSNKKKKRKERGAARKKKESSYPVLLYLKLCFHPLSSLVF